MVFLELARKNVTRKRERSLLTIVAVLLAIGSFISLLSIAEGGYQKTRAELDGRDVSLYVLPRDVHPLPGLAVGNMTSGADTLPPGLAQDVAQKYPLVDRVTGVVHLTVAHESRNIVVWGIEPSALETFLPNLALTSGRALQGGGEAILGVRLARELGLAEGATLTLGRINFQVVGLADSKSGLQASYCYIAAADAQALGELKGVHEIWLHLKDEGSAQDIAGEMNQAYPDVSVYTRQQYLGDSLQVVSYAWLVQFAVASIGVLISMTAAMNTMLMSTYERMKEFGTLRAIGTPRTTVMLMILTESMILSLLGGVGGILLGVVGSHIFDVAVTTLFRFSFSLASITPGLILNALLLSAAVGLVGAAIPCYLVYQMEIIKALRSD